MSASNYSLEIISHHPQFHNKSLRQYCVDGINTVGAWGNEPFEVRFHNNTYNKIQVKLSLDGTDVFTGKPANTNCHDKMWVVNAYSTIKLSAWCESDHGGAAFVFTDVNNSVAAHTHGDMSSRGIIAAAVFTESYVAPVVCYNPYTYCHACGISHYLSCCPRNLFSGSGRLNDFTIIGGTTWYNSTVSSAGQPYNSNSINNSISYNAAESNTVGSFDLCDEIPVAVSSNGGRSKQLQSQASVGAGQHVNQNITYVSGLVKPSFAESIRVRYIWWDTLKDALRANNFPVSHASGFPGDRPNINLGGVPRVGEKHGCFRRAEAEYSRV